jgi:hypothetical protein
MIFVEPESFAAFTVPGNKGRYEEIFHSQQFAVLGNPAFYALYGASSALAGLSGEDWYQGNTLEETAKSAAESLANMYARERPCG